MSIVYFLHHYKIENHFVIVISCNRGGRNFHMRIFRMITGKTKNEWHPFTTLANSHVYLFGMRSCPSLISYRLRKYNYGHNFAYKFNYLSYRHAWICYPGIPSRVSWQYGKKYVPSGYRRMILQNGRLIIWRHI